jgi:sterol 14-demethylase
MKPTPPVLEGPPIVGHALQLMKDPGILFQRGLDTLGPIFTIQLGRQKAAVLIGPEYQQTFFMETDKKFSMHKTYRFLKAALGEVGFTGPPEVYMEQRPILHQPFKGEKAANSVKIMQIEVQQWLDSLGEQGEMELTGEITRLVQNVASHALMGKKFRDQVGPEFWRNYLIIGKSLDPVLPPNLPLPKFIRRDRAKNRLRAILRPMIAERRANPDDYDDILQDYVNARYKDGRIVDDETILSLILALMFAGHETTAGQAAWTLIQLLQNPSYLQMMQQEIDASLAPGQTVDAKSLSVLKHAYWAVQETTRMQPSVDMLIRRAEEDVEMGDYRIPEGWVVFVSVALAQRLPSLFTDPNRYDPLRFAPDRAEDRKHRFSIIDFGGGIHKCAGMNFANNEMAMITALLFQQFELELVTKNPGVFRGTGASRPEKTIIRYRRKSRAALSSTDQVAAVVACPHLKEQAQTGCPVPHVSVEGTESPEVVQ